MYFAEELEIVYLEKLHFVLDLDLVFLSFFSFFSFQLLHYHLLLFLVVQLVDNSEIVVD